MRFIVNRGEFLAELTALKSVFGEKGVVNPNIALQAIAGKVTIIANDSLTRMVGEVPAKVVKDGNVAIHGTAFLSLCKALPNGEITLEALPNNWLAIDAGEFKAKLPGTSLLFEGENPSDLNSSITIKSDELSRLVGDTRFIVMRGDETTLAKGALLEVAGDAMRMVTTDGHRLALSNVGSIEGKDTRQLVMSRRSLGQLKAILDQYKGDVQVTYNDRSIRFVAGTREMSARLISGWTYPPYRKVIPAEGPLKATAGLEALQLALKRTTLLAKEECSVVLTLSEGEILVEARDMHEVDSAQESLDATVAGDVLPRRLKFAARYLNDVLSALAGDNVTIQAQAGEGMPVVFRSAENPDRGLHVVVPQKEKQGQDGNKAA